MRTIRVKNQVYTELEKRAIQIQDITAKKVSLSTTTYLLLKFVEQNKAYFKAFLLKRRRFSVDYEKRLQTMRSNGIPTSRDLQKDV